MIALRSDLWLVNWRRPLATVGVLGIVLLAACSDDPPNDVGATTADAGGTPDSSSDIADAAGPPAKDAGASNDAGPGKDAGSSKDAGKSDSGADAGTDAADGGCVTPAPQTPVLGTMTCNTYDFGLPANTVQNVANAVVFNGGTILPGIYDATAISRTTGSLSYTFQATLVFTAGGTFSEVRQLQTGSSPITRKSGTFATAVEGGVPTLVRNIDCGGSGDGGLETNKLPYWVQVDCAGKVQIHMGTANLWFTYTRRP
jgi:hypothetical protein